MKTGEGENVDTEAKREQPQPEGVEQSEQQEQQQQSDKPLKPLDQSLLDILDED